MHEIGVIAGCQSIKDRVGLPQRQVVPAHVRHLQRRIFGRDRLDLSADPAEPGRDRVFVATVGQHLHADADPHERHPAPPHRLVQRLAQAVPGVERRAAGRERAVAGQHDPVGPRNRVRVGRHLDRRHARIAAHQGKGLFRRMKVAAAVVDQQQPHQSAPLVDGSRPSIRGSGSTASRSARASALNAASAMWWAFSPRIRSTCRVMPA